MIFVSYRRADSAGHAGRIYDRLSGRYGRDCVFMDLDIEAGADFGEVVVQRLALCHAIVVIIGRDWVDAADDAGARRLDDPDDWVAIELRTALASGKPILPVLVQGAVMPREDQLPADLSSFARRNALELSDTRWEYDTDRLLMAVEKSVPADVLPPELPRLVHGRARHDVLAGLRRRIARVAARPRALAVLATALAVASLGLWQGVSRRSEPLPTPIERTLTLRREDPGSAFPGTVCLGNPALPAADGCMALLGGARRQQILIFEVPADAAQGRLAKAELGLRGLLDPSAGEPPRCIAARIDDAPLSPGTPLEIGTMTTGGRLSDEPELGTVAFDVPVGGVPDLQAGEHRVTLVIPADCAADGEAAFRDGWLSITWR